jgi:hypothetical protein
MLIWVTQFQDPRGPKPSIDQGSHDGRLSGQTGLSFSDPTSLIFALTPEETDIQNYYPTPTNAFFLWQKFLENINPLSKLIHAPSVQILVIAASQDLASISKASIAVLFSIYAAATSSMKDSQCLQSLKESKTQLLDRYLGATQRALTAAGIMKSLDLIILQAFSIYMVRFM